MFRAIFPTLFLLSLLSSCTATSPEPTTEQQKSLNLQKKTDKVAPLAEALRLLEEENYSVAIEILTPMAKSAGSQFYEVQQLLAHCNAKSGKITEAIEHYKNLVSPSYALADLAMYELAGLYQKNDNLSEAELWYERLNEQYPHSLYLPSAKLGLVKLANSQGKYAHALEQLDQLIAEKNSGSSLSSLYLLRGEIQEKLEKFPDAQKSYQLLINRNSSNRVAKEALDRLEKLLPEHSKLKLRRKELMRNGMVFYRHREFKKARRNFRKVAGNRKDRLAGEAIFQVGKSYFREKKYDDAIREYKKIRTHYPSSGFFTSSLYHIGRSHRRKGNISKAQKIFRSIGEKYSWSKLADNSMYHVARLYEEKNQFDRAIVQYRQILRKHRRSPLVPRIYWRIGWLQFKSKKYSKSIKTFAQLRNRFPKDSWASAGYFWTAKALERQGKSAEATKIYSEIAQSGKWYYSNLAIDRLNGNHEIANFTRTKTKENDPAWDKIGQKKSPRVQLLMKLKLYEAAAIDLKKLVKTDRFNLRDNYYNLSICYQKIEKFQSAHYYAVKLAELPNSDESGAIPLELHKMLYPFHYREQVVKHSTKYEIDPFFVLSMMREESRYNSEVISPAGAFGLMQIMPYTGEKIAAQIDFQPFNAEQLFEPDLNIQMGAWYLKSLLNDFHGSKELASGAYNGGPDRIKRWQNEMPSDDLDEFIEDIPIDETRRHIKKVLESYRIYRQLYRKSDLLSLLVAE